MSDEMKKALEQLTSEVAEDVANKWRRRTLQRINSAPQGADGLSEYVSDVRKEGESFVFEINHPTASLHERGGHIEPKFATSQLFGWTRNEFYEALTDCNENVTKKRLVRQAADDMRRGNDV